MKKTNILTNKQGMTLIEMLVVIVIIGLLAGLVGPKLFKKVEDANVKAAKAQIRLFEGAMDQFRLDVGRYPNTQEGLKALLTNPGGLERWNGPYLKGGSIPLDPWNKPYVYASPGSHGEYDLYSFGKDGVQGGDGDNKDIASWD